MIVVVTINYYYALFEQRNIEFNLAASKTHMLLANWYILTSLIALPSQLDSRLTNQ